ncbi:hypothetical protein EC988_005085 [Linderina pennispora]|nr:hypothetical protein EC988_005085 [Linderina pennispora]
MQTNQDLKNEIMRLEAQLALAKQHPPTAYRPNPRPSYQHHPYSHSYHPRPSRNLRLVVKNDASSAPGPDSPSTASQYMSSGNKLVRVGSGSEASIRPPAPRPPRRTVVRPSRIGRNLTLKNPAEPPAEPPAKPPAETEAPPASVNSRGTIEVDGKQYLVSSTKLRLLRGSAEASAAGESSATDSNGSQQATSDDAPITPIDSESYVRTGSSSLVRTRVLQEHRTMREKEKEQRQRLCPQFMYGCCKFASSKCRNSHTPSPMNTPVCSHFQHDKCTRDPCLFLHVKTNANAPICRPFVFAGFCEKGPKCLHRHVWECPDWVEKNRCSRSKCRFPHPVKPVASNESAAQKGNGDASDSDDDDVLKLYDGNDPSEDANAQA